MDLYHGKEPKVSLNECYYDPAIGPYDSKILEDYRDKGIFDISDNKETPYSIKIVKEKDATYETTPHYSAPSQNWIYGEGHPKRWIYEDNPPMYDYNNPRTFNPELWDYYYGS